MSHGANAITQPIEEFCPLAKDSEHECYIEGTRAVWAFLSESTVFALSQRGRERIEADRIHAKWRLANGRQAESQGVR